MARGINQTSTPLNRARKSATRSTHIRAPLAGIRPLFPRSPPHRRLSSPLPSHDDDAEETHKARLIATVNSLSERFPGICAELQYLSECKTRRDLTHDELARYLELKQEGADRVARENERKQHSKRFGGFLERGEEGDGEEVNGVYGRVVRNDQAWAARRRPKGNAMREDRKGTQEDRKRKIAVILARGDLVGLDSPPRPAWIRGYHAHAERLPEWEGHHLPDGETDNNFNVTERSDFMPPREHVAQAAPYMGSNAKAPAQPVEDHEPGDFRSPAHHTGLHQLDAPEDDYDSASFDGLTHPEEPSAQTLRQSLDLTQEAFEALGIDPPGNVHRVNEIGETDSQLPPLASTERSVLLSPSEDNISPADFDADADKVFHYARAAVEAAWRHEMADRDDLERMSRAELARGYHMFRAGSEEGHDSVPNMEHGPSNKYDRADLAGTTTASAQQLYPRQPVHAVHDTIDAGPAGASIYYGERIRPGADEHLYRNIHPIDDRALEQDQGAFAPYDDHGVLLIDDTLQDPEPYPFVGWRREDDEYHHPPEEGVFQYEIQKSLAGFAHGHTAPDTPYSA